MPLKITSDSQKKTPCIVLDNVQLTENATSVLQESEMDFNKMTFNSF
jgi:hypothetical protein